MLLSIFLSSFDFLLQMALNGLFLCWCAVKNLLSLSLYDDIRKLSQDSSLDVRHWMSVIEVHVICVVLRCVKGSGVCGDQVLGIYTFTKRVNLDDGEAKPRRAQGYSTVSHFNVIHIECHLAAVRLVYCWYSADFILILHEWWISHSIDTFKCCLKTLLSVVK